jgi:DNA-binding LacI/PurR family transcriptional regulator
VVKNLLNEQRICCWLLLSVSEGLQRWFDREKLCAVVVGSCFDEVQLPSIDYDYAALARHAVGLLVGRGHQRLALLRPTDVTAGFLAGETGFLQGIKEAADRHAVRGAVWRLKDEPEAVFGQIDRIMTVAEAPTALIVTRTVHAVSVASKLLTLGRKIPQDVSLICLTEDPHLRGFHPAIAAYRLAPKIFADRLRRIVLQAATTGDLSARRHFIGPELAPGRSIAPPGNAP